MLVRIGFVVLTLLSGIAIGGNLISNPTDRYISIRYVDEGERTKVLAEHTLALDTDGMLNFNSGGETTPREGETAIPFGTQVTGKLTSIGNASYAASISLKLGNPVLCGTPATQIVRSECLELQTVLKKGVEARIPCGGNRWIELRIDN